MDSRTATLLGLATVALALVACGDDTGGGGGGDTTTSSTGGTGGAPPATWTTGECGTCFASACATSIDACAADPGCASYLDCLDACPSDAEGGPPNAECAAACPVADSSTAQAAFEALDECRTRGDAATECPTCGFGDSQECEPSVDPNPCYACDENYCCEAFETYVANPEAVAIRDCVVACPEEGNAACTLGCYEQHPEGLADWGARLSCVVHHCAGPEACGEGPVDPCIQCVIDNCADLQLACDSEPECFLIQACGAACPGVCVEECVDEHPGGEERFNALVACQATECTAQCQ